VCVNAELTTQGKITGGVNHEMPSWFSDSFLDINEDVIEAKENNKNIMLFFHLADCPYCDTMINENFRGGNTTQFIQNRFSVIAINIKGDREITLSENMGITEKALSQKLKIQYTPTIVFFNKEGKIIYKINGYRSPEAFKYVLNYIDDKAYNTMTLSSYIEKHNSNTDNAYDFIPHQNLQKVNYFKDYKKPVALLFEDKDCTDCEFLHKHVINQKQVISEIDNVLFVRLDAYSDDKIIDFHGRVTTPRKWANELGLNYRPGIVLFNDMKEITRIDGKLFSFHFKEVFRYVSGEFYKKYPSYNAYLVARQKELVNKGIDIDITQ
ncbi:MAG: thioredoxin fold domain-containing protein, partial [Gammaproteobacteria bacterium]|nr:thioredoxin fold domain-containing protein [Gammaproteobacteria bacterium]